MNRIYTILFTLLVLPLTLSAQKSYLEQVGIEALQVKKEGAQVEVKMTLRLDPLHLNTNDLLILTPVVRQSDGTLMQVLPQVQVAGRVRDVILERHHIATVPDNRDNEIAHHVVRKNRSEQVVDYHATLPFEEWMYEGEFLITEQLYGCADCFRYEGGKVLLTPFVKAPYVPQLQLTYIEPEVEPVKARADKHTATLNFRSAKHDLDRNYKSNGIELDQVDQVMREIQSNKDIEVTELTVVGYASPEGGFAYNKALAGRRANSFAQYLGSKFGISQSQMSIEGYGEDWVMTREVIAASTIQDREAILRIIDTVSDPDARDPQLKKLSGGATYRTMLNDYYPRIRRTEYTVAYKVRPFSVEEAREIIKTNPKLLSLNEMYLVAQSYPAESKEFKEVFDIAVRLYPEEPVAIINASAADIEGGNYQAAIERLAKLGNDPTAMNNRGVAHLRLGELEEARALFQRASEAGSTQATHNLEELRKMEQQR